MRRFYVVFRHNNGHLGRCFDVDLMKGELLSEDKLREWIAYVCRKADVETAMIENVIEVACDAGGGEDSYRIVV